jgi:DMSO/TMAO reductase YedYZ heme-binding membrane subunit
MYLGVGGFFFGLSHALLSLFFYIVIEAESPAYFFEQQWNVFGIMIPNQLAFLFGVLSLIVFGFMALISMKRFILKLGGLLWRELLRKFGFFALTTVLIHFFIKDFNKWVDPDSWGRGLPPSNLLLFVLGLFVLLLRIALSISLSRKKV